MLGFLGLGIRQVWGLGLGLSLIALAAVVFFGIWLINIKSVIRWQRLVWQSTKANQHLRSAEEATRH